MAAFRPSFCIESRPGLTLQVQFKKPAGPMMMMMMMMMMAASHARYTIIDL